MRFVDTLTKLTNENTALKWVVISLAVLLLGLSLLIATLATRAPLVIERECQSRAVQLTDAAPTNPEIEAFVREVLHERFDFEGQPSAALLSVSELKASTKDRTELKDRGMKQRLFLNGILRQGDKLEVDTDRLISVGDLRSAFKFPLVLTLGSTVRTVANPYGLILVGTEPKVAKEEAKTTNQILPKTEPSLSPGGNHENGH
ncbi:MAG: hypothetical protein JST16_02800 [Bdellovibrionales bacterium]|nr:hypothetical protein [Bdellovibrionales bacterium]